MIVAAGYLTTQPQRHQLQAAYEVEYREGLLGQVNLINLLDAADHNTDRNDLILRRVNSQILVDETKLLIAQYALLFKGGVYSDAQFRGQLAAISVKLQIDRQQTNVYVPNWTKGNFDAAVALNGGSVDPYLQYSRYFSTDGSLKVPAGLADPKLDQLLTQGNAAADLAARKQVFGQLQQTLLADSPWVWLFRNETYYLTGKGVTGFKPLPTESLQYLRETSAP